MIYYKFCAPMRGTRKVYLYSQSFTAVNGIIEFEEEPSPNIRIALGMRRYRRVEDSAVKTLKSHGTALRATVAPSKPPGASGAPEGAPEAPHDDSRVSKLVKRVFEGKKPSKKS